ncbi:AMP-dependent synthetase/ligase [Planomonospora venezuelensis]|uniref:Acyl-CoA synthetase n=1 Tax=Planomonospora venezuelensis TaxID=1999 RepID=A0A841D0C6_PLAVE|nr:long-chain fatty acid--CoA ligase [Planomonospora venezuelensis]MBB5964112.1 long-chain acyl-CoA synthetase [Planomonospora venezuelensis]GIM99736.1 AMP-dependent synthetase [Planomonospora venezuelensis]
MSVEYTGSLPALLRSRVRATPYTEAFRHPSGDGWACLTWSETGERVRALALGLRELGLEPGTRAAVLCGTRVEWIVADLAVLSTGAATTTIYPSNTAAECAFILTDSGSVLVVAENDDQVAKLRSVRSEIPAVKHVVVIDGEADEEGWVLTLDQVARSGEEAAAGGAGEYDRMVDAVTEDDLATLIYTSGTTGRPKGVELTHRNWLQTARAAAQIELLTPDDLHFLWLPMSHSFGKLLESVMIAVGTPTVVDGRLDRIAANLGAVRPTVMAAAPRIFEKIHNTVAATVQREGGIKLKLFRWARGVGLETVRARQEGRALSPGLRARHALADRLVFAKLRARFGGRIRYFISGSAPLSLEMAEFFDAAGLTILEGYGLTESSAGSFVNRPGNVRFGTVGPPLPGVTVRIAEDGEILIGGHGIMRGYHGLPEESAEALQDGWLHTGDIGELDEAGRLRITDRKKELIKTSGGKYVAPQHLEGRIKAACPFLSHVVVHGDRRNYCTALVTLDADVVAPWAQAEGLPSDPAELCAHPRLREEVRRAIETVNADLASYETVKDFAVLPADFTVESGELTPSMKVRRREVEERNRELLDSLYRNPVERV